MWGLFQQRNAGASVTLTSSGDYTVDRFIGYEDTDGAMTAQQDSSAPTGFVNSLKCTTTTADGTLASGQYVTLIQKIEGTNVSDLAWGSASAKTITLSFWVRSSLTGSFGGSLRNSANNRSYPFSYTISSANTWEQKTVTIAGDTTGTWLTTTGVGIQVAFGLGVGSTYSGTAGAWAGSNLVSVTGAVSVIGTLNATWYITGVQLEVGSTATPFERRPYGTELALCQRYLPAYLGSSLAVQYQGQASSTTSAYIPIPHPVTTRAAPTGITTSSMNAIVSNSTGGGVAVTNLTFTQAGVSSTLVQATVASGLTAGNASFLIFNSGTLFFTGCEL